MSDIEHSRLGGPDRKLEHDWLLVYGRWRAIAQSAAGSLAGITVSPFFEDDFDEIRRSFRRKNQTFPAVRVQDVEHSARFAIVGSVMQEVVGSGMLSLPKGQADVRPVRQPVPLFLCRPTLPQVFDGFVT